MFSKIYLTTKIEDTREKRYLKSWKELGTQNNIKSVKLIDAYLIESNLNNDDLLKVANSLTNPILDTFSINRLPIEKNFSFLIEIGFLPGVTDNVSTTVKESINDLLGNTKTYNLNVYTSKIFLIDGIKNIEDIKKIALTLHNPLIESSKIFSFEEIKENKHLNYKAPEVMLEDGIGVMDINLNISDQELIKIGNEGILDKHGNRRGPLALDIISMKEIQKHFKSLGRNPTDIELESLSQTWSEHCKHTIFANSIDDIKDGLYKTYIKDATNIIRKNKGKNDFCVSVFSDNSGGIIFDENHLITHKVETHNSPAALDPFGASITGIVGVNRDTIGFGLGAKPVANTFGFCFGDPEDTTPIFRDKEKKQRMFLPKRTMEGVIKGVNVGGNCSGIPTLSGFVRYDDRFKGKPLVFVGTVGIIPKKINSKLSHKKKAEAGDYVVVVGGRVGIDGIHGATFSSVEMDSKSPATAVQIGDPITQKKLSDAIIKEAREMNLYNSITDNGAGGISCSVAEMAKECGGVIVDIDKVPLKYKGLSPWQIWISESQERMTLSVPKKKWEVFNQLMKNRGVESTIIGEFTNSKKCIVRHKSKIIMDISLDFLHDGLPKRNLSTEILLNKYSEPKESTSYSSNFLTLLSQKNISGFSFISDQYDHEVQASSVLKPTSGRGRINTDAQVFRPVLASKKGAILSSSLYPSYGDISTYHMASCALDTTIRNIICAGGTLSHLAILDNFCWCSSYEKNRLYQLVESLKAIHKYAIGYGTPFISGKDSMFNDFKGYDQDGNPIKISIPPTILISGIGVIENINTTISPEFKKSQDLIYILGDTNKELGASEYFKMLAKKENNNSLGNVVPKVNLEKNLKTYSILEESIKKNLINSAISVNSGGLVIALAKASIGGMLGCKISLENIKGEATTVEEKLFSESQGRVLISISPKNLRKFEKIAKNISFTKLGKVSKDLKFIIKSDPKKDIINSDIKNLHKIYHNFSEKMK